MKSRKMFALRPIITISSVLSLCLTSSSVHAHHMLDNKIPATFMEGLLSGLAHPVIGVDHLAFLIVTGVLMGSFTGSKRFLLPAVLVVATLAGTTLHLLQTDVPFTELIIALSVLIGGGLILSRMKLTAISFGLGIAAFGVFHGYAYGESIIGAENSPLAAYLLGFSLLQYCIIVAIGWGTSEFSRRWLTKQILVYRVVGSLATFTGGAFLIMNIM